MSTSLKGLVEGVKSFVKEDFSLDNQGLLVLRALPDDVEKYEMKISQLTISLVIKEDALLVKEIRLNGSQILRLSDSYMEAFSRVVLKRYNGTPVDLSLEGANLPPDNDIRLLLGYGDLRCYMEGAIHHVKYYLDDELVLVSQGGDTLLSRSYKAFGVAEGLANGGCKLLAQYIDKKCAND